MNWNFEVPPGEVIQPTLCLANLRYHVVLVPLTKFLLLLLFFLFFLLWGKFSMPAGKAGIELSQF